MNNWLKTGLLGAAGVGLLVASGGTLAAPFAGLSSILGGEGAAAAGGTAAADAMADAGISSTLSTATPTAFVSPPVTGMYASAPTSGLLDGTSLGYGSAAANPLLGEPATAASSAVGNGMLANPAAAGNPLLGAPAASGANLSGSLAGTNMAYGGSAGLANAPSTDPSAMQKMGQQLMGYAKTAGSGIGKAATAYGQVNNAMGGNQPIQQAPQGRPIFSGEPVSFAQSAGIGGTQPAANQNLLLAQIARRRQMGY